MILLGAPALADPLKVLLIDAGNPDVAIVGGSNVSSEEMYHRTAEHAKVMYNIITKANCLSYTVDWCNYYDVHNDKRTTREYLRCLSLSKKYDIVNLSLAGQDTLRGEELELAKAEGTIFSAAAGNDGKYELYYPAKYSEKYANIIPISATDCLGTRLPSSNWFTNSLDICGVMRYDKKNTMRGTSVAAAQFTKTLIEEICPSRKEKNARRD